MGLCYESERYMTRPDEQAVANVIAYIAKREGSTGRYSEDNHKSFSPLHVIQEKSSLNPYPYLKG
jgi:hypothetical protein